MLLPIEPSISIVILCLLHIVITFITLMGIILILLQFDHTSTMYWYSNETHHS